MKRFLTMVAYRDFLDWYLALVVRQQDEHILDLVVYKPNNLLVLRQGVGCGAQQGHWMDISELPESIQVKGFTSRDPMEYPTLSSPLQQKKEQQIQLFSDPLEKIQGQPLTNWPQRD